MQRLKKGVRVRFRPQSTPKAGFEIEIDEVGTIVHVETNPPPGFHRHVDVQFARQRVCVLAHELTFASASAES